MMKDQTLSAEDQLELVINDLYDQGKFREAGILDACMSECHSPEDFEEILKREVRV